MNLELSTMPAGYRAFGFYSHALQARQERWGFIDQRFRSDTSGSIQLTAPPNGVMRVRSSLKRVTQAFLKKASRLPFLSAAVLFSDRRGPCRTSMRRDTRFSLCGATPEWPRVANAKEQMD